MAESQKKVVVRPFSGPPISGYLPATGFTVASQIALMDAVGKIINIDISNIKLIAYVKDFKSGDASDPERLGRRSFTSRPRSEGLWVRLTFSDGDVLEGLAAADITFLDAAVTDQGIVMTPPDARSNTHRVYVPRLALRNLELLGVITSAAKRKATKPDREPEPWLFDNN